MPAFQPLPRVANLSCAFVHDLANVISNSAANIQLGITGNRHSYSNLLTAGCKDPLVSDSAVFEFVDITIPNVSYISSGAASMLALTHNGDVFGRGKNGQGELATGDNTVRQSWTKIEGFPCAVKEIAFNYYHSLFLTTNGQVFSCGSNGFGQLVFNN